MTDVFIVGTRSISDGKPGPEEIFVWFVREESWEAAELSVRFGQLYSGKQPRSLKTEIVLPSTIRTYREKLFGENAILWLWGYSLLTDSKNIQVGTVMAQTRDLAKNSIEIRHHAVFREKNALAIEKIPIRIILPDLNDTARRFRERLPKI